jgi:hypothetical protein
MTTPPSGAPMYNLSYTDYTTPILSTQEISAESKSEMSKMKKAAILQHVNAEGRGYILISSPLIVIFIMLIIERICRTFWAGAPAFIKSDWLFVLILCAGIIHLAVSFVYYLTVIQAHAYTRMNIERAEATRGMN